jgi:hypothetical protein
MVNTARGELKARLQVFLLKIGHFVEYLFGGQSGCEQVQDIGDTDTHSTYARTTAALRRIDGYSRLVVHGSLFFA